MDNHAHLLIYAENVENLGHFMRTVNSQPARFINNSEDRDSQAIKERYKMKIVEARGSVQGRVKAVLETLT